MSNRVKRYRAKEIASRIGASIGCESKLMPRSRGDSGFMLQLNIEPWLEINRIVGDEDLEKWGLMDDLEKAFKIKQAVENIKLNRLRTEESLARSIA